MLPPSSCSATRFAPGPFRFSTLRGPRQNNVDLALLKQTRITEGKNIEFRAEALNAANHPYFPNPNMTVTTAQSVKDTRLRADQRFHHEQLCPPAADEPAVDFLVQAQHRSSTRGPVPG